jgi:NAD(P)-dependent dehydrogenase (short-subunit alcohol dehydrogenase family)
MTKTVLVTGAGRGVGLEFARQYAADGWRVIATCRDPGKASALRGLKGDVDVRALDVADLDAIAKLADALQDEAIDVLINNAGIMGGSQSLGSIDYEDFARALRVNAMAPLRLAECFAPHVARGTDKRIASLSSIMGSIGNNASGGYYNYRASKAALNAAMKSLAADLAPKGIVVVVFHPGWVRTDMGGASAPVTPEASVAGMRALIAGLKPADAGRFFTYEGRELPW